MAALASRQQDLSHDDRAAAAAAARRRPTRSDRARRVVRPDQGVRGRADSRASSSSTRRSAPALPWLAQATALRLAERARRAAQRPDARRSRTPRASLTATEDAAAAEPTLLARCFIHNVIPTGNEVIQDPPAHDGAAGLPGAVPVARSGSPAPPRTSTATAATCAPSAGGGSDPCQTGSLAGGGPAVRQRGAAAARHPSGVSRPRAAAGQQRRRASRTPAPNLNNVSTGAGAVKRAILIHRRDFIAIIVAGRCSRSAYRVVHPRPPAVVHAVRQELLHGQGAVRRAPRPSPRARARRSTIAGVQVGQVGGVHAPERARRRDDEHLQAVRADLPQRHRPAAAAHAAEGHVPGARPGHAERRARSRTAARSSAANTNPDVDVSQILSSLDADTRNYLLLLLAAARRRSTIPAPPGRAAEPGRGRRPARHLQAVRAAEPRHARRSPAARRPATQNIAPRRSTTSSLVADVARRASTASWRR